VDECKPLAGGAPPGYSARNAAAPIPATQTPKQQKKQQHQQQQQVGYTMADGVALV